MFRTYIPKSFQPKSCALIATAQTICAEYAADGFDLSLRQLYYQFVARGIIANKDTEYDRLGSLINDARLAGLIDWEHIVDRTRELRQSPHWDSPADIVAACAKQFQVSKWADQPTRVEVWIEKDALVGVLKAVCPQNDVPYFSCRGYTSQSEIWAAAQRLREYTKNGAENVVVIHLGDHDPSGIDMSRDIEARLRLFWAVDAGLVDPAMIQQELCGERLEDAVHDAIDCLGDEVPLTIERIALNMDQVRILKPPPNPAKLTDSRARGYVAKFGSESWELDALDPRTLVSLIQKRIRSHRDQELWDAAVSKETQAKKELTQVSVHWDTVTRVAAARS